ncbi:MAG TPA: MotA/TolQ/ExbB proton channel family protein [Halomicronema sp.]
MAVNNLFAAGGVVMWPLLGFSVLSLTLILERISFWFRVLTRQDKLVRDVLVVYRRNPDAVRKQLEQNLDLPVSRIFLAALSLDRPNLDEFRLALESAAQAELPLLRRFNTVFDTIIGISPLLGLLGTVLGLIQTFASLRLGDIGGTSTGNVTAGISEALVSTASGLVVAIFTLLFANTFRGLYQRQRALILEYGGQLELLYRRRFGGQGDKPIK